MPQAEFDILTLSPSTVRVMHREAHHIYEFALIDNGCGRRVVSQGPSIHFAQDAAVPAWDFVAEAERVADEVARRTGMIE